MNKIAIIGLGLVGNSIGMALKRAYAAEPDAPRLAGFDPDRSREEAALRRYNSVDEIAPNLEQAVRGAQLIILATPSSATREVLGAIAPFVDESMTITDTLSTKAPVMAWAKELLDGRASFIGGHPFSKSMDLEAATGDDIPGADLFLNAPYAIMPLPNARNEALNIVISLVESLGAHPLFIDPVEHDSFLAATSHLAYVASAALIRVTSKSPGWSDMRGFANRQFKSVTDPMATDAQVLTDALIANRQMLLSWLDQYLLTLQDLREQIAGGDRAPLLASITDCHDSRDAWANDEPDDAKDARLKAELRDAINDARPAHSLMGNYLADRFFRKKKGQ
jgi:prephenate dehydrogenase